MTKETKMTGAGGDVRGALSDFLYAFEAFKDANDQRLGQIERKQADVVTAEKVDRINAALTQQQSLLERLALDSRRSGLGGAAPVDERKSAFDGYLRTGDISGILETKDLSSGSDGGYIVPPETEAIIDRRLSAASPIRAIASVKTVGSNLYKKPVSLGDAYAGWADETTARSSATAASELKSLEFPTAELYAMPAATQTLLDDTHVDMDAWLAEEVEEVFAAQEGAAFINGTGTNQPKGFLSYTIVADASHAWDSIGYIATGKADDFADTDPIDALLDLITAPKSMYRANGRFVMNRRTVAATRKLKDGDGAYIWHPPSALGEPATLLGHAVTEAEDMPDMNHATKPYAIAFGDFARGYLVVDRVGVRVLRDPFSAKPYVLFYTTKRVGGGVQNFDAIKLLKFAAS